MLWTVCSEVLKEEEACVQLVLGSSMESRVRGHTSDLVIGI